MSHAVLQGQRFELSIEDSGYPQVLAQTIDPPSRLYGIGNPEALVPSIAVIGARQVTPYGRVCTQRFARQAAARGLCIVSGGARGCDQIAHRAALDEGIQTIVVFGSAPDVVYPKQGFSLFQEVIDTGGAVISEQKWGSKPLPYYFRLRNRIIAGLSMMLIIAEAGLPSGTFSTADAALSAGREVAVVPGSILSPYSKGTNRLLTQGAIPLVDEESLNDALDIAFERMPLSIMEATSLSDKDKERSERIKLDPILAALAADAYSADELAAYFDFSPTELSMRLSQYEIQGFVERHKDGRYFLV